MLFNFFCHRFELDATAPYCSLQTNKKKTHGWIVLTYSSSWFFLEWLFKDFIFIAKVTHVVAIKGSHFIKVLPQISTKVFMCCCQQAML